MFALPMATPPRRSAESGPGIPRETRAVGSGMLPTAGGVIERRRAVELSTASGRKLTGYAAVFEQETRVSGFTEVIRPGAFKSALPGRDILALIDHDPSRLLARTKSGTLRLEEDTRGLRFELDLPDTQEGRDILTLAERGDLGGASFGFTVPKGGEHWTGQKRELRAVTLHEISVVHSWPAYEGTEIHARAKAPGLAAAKRYLETV